MTSRVERHHWLATYVGILDGAFYLSEEELYAVTNIVKKLLLFLRVPERAQTERLPVPVAQEVAAQYYTVALAARDSLPRMVRPTTGQDCVVSLEAWREAFVALLTDTYPDISVDERLVISKVFTDLLAAIGLPHRAAAFHPDMVIHAHQAVDRVI